jgi:hypothetical protein
MAGDVYVYVLIGQRWRLSGLVLDGSADIRDELSILCGQFDTAAFDFEIHAPPLPNWDCPDLVADRASRFAEQAAAGTFCW